MEGEFFGRCVVELMRLSEIEKRECESLSWDLWGGVSEDGWEGAQEIKSLKGKRQSYSLKFKIADSVCGANKFARQTGLVLRRGYCVVRIENRESIVDINWWHT